MDWASLAFPGFTWEFLTGIIQIFLIDIVLAGDNAVVIALAVKSLPREQRMIGIGLGAGFAVALRVVLCFFAAQLMTITYVKLVGGILIFWIGCKLLLQDQAHQDSGKEASNVWSAVWIILVADVTMSTDNILALAGASKGNLFLLVFGLILSIPLVVFTSSLLSRLMDKYRIIVYAGAAVLGKVSASLIFSDPAVERHVTPPAAVLYSLEAAFAVFVIVVPLTYLRLRRRQRPSAAT